MNGTVILVSLAILVFIVTVVFIIVSVRNPKARIEMSKHADERRTGDEFASKDFRSKKIKCVRCGGNAHGVLGTSDVYRCRSCGFRNKAP